jgi:hypothetical protein
MGRISPIPVKDTLTDRLLLMPVATGCMDLKKRMSLLSKMSLGLGALGFWMVLLSCYVGASRILGGKSDAVSSWLIYVGAEFIVIAVFIMFYVIAYVAPAIKDEEE